MYDHKRTAGKGRSITWLTGLASAAAGLELWALMPGHASREQREPFDGLYAAHRGLHEIEAGVPENSLPAFEAACAAGYGIELDVQLSRDGQVVVFHDDTLDRVCGVEGRVDSYDLAELQQMRLCGTGETIPLFTQVLDVTDGRAPLIVELKAGPRWKELCQKTLDLLLARRGPYCVESFDPRIVAWFRFHAPHMMRGQLLQRPEDYRPDVPRILRCLQGWGLLTWTARPQFIAYKLGKIPRTVRLIHRLGAMRVCWTSREPGQESGQDTVIFEKYRPATHFR